jgi:hypothetical protein
MDENDMVPISRGKQLAGIVGAVVIGYSLSWLVTPGPGTGPVDNFHPTFAQRVTPMIVAPAAPGSNRAVEASEPLNGSPAPLQPRPYQPI